MTAITNLPEPLVPAEVDLRDFPFMPLHVAQLLDSETWLLATGDEAKAAVTLWCKAWHQKPSGSLPNDDRVLAALSGAGPKWKRVKSVALRGFVHCSDGRLYHSTIAEMARDSWASKVAQRERTKAATEAREKRRKEREAAEKPRDEQRDVQHEPTTDVARDEQRDVHQETGTGTGTGILDSDADDACAPDPIRVALDSIGAWDDPNCRIHGARVMDWIRQGANLDLDIVPTLKAVLSKARKRRDDPAFLPTSLNFFDQAVADAVAARTRPLPETTTGGAHHAPASDRQRTRSQPYDPAESRRRTAEGFALAVEREERGG